GRLVWVAGHRIDHDFRLTPASVSALRVQIRPLDLLSTNEGAP
ncbi:MAG: hypothetical protein QOD01_500, partial [Actinomycetota bacterium]|nr:hypothetical protein [Actinomycetota bacterium]